MHSGIGSPGLKWQSVTVRGLSSNVVGGLPCRKRGRPGFSLVVMVGHYGKLALASRILQRYERDWIFYMLIVIIGGSAATDCSHEALLTIVQALLSSIMSCSPFSYSTRDPFVPSRRDSNTISSCWLLLLLGSYKRRSIHLHIHRKADPLRFPTQDLLGPA